MNIPVARIARSAGRVAGALFGIAVALPVAAQLYIWTDEKGVRQYTDTIPPATATDVIRKEVPSGPSQDGAEPYVLQLAREKFPVTLYTSPTCGLGCDEARRHLNERGIPFSEISVVDQARYDELKKISPDAAIPIMRVGETLQRGYQHAAFESALDAAGYPRLGMLPPRSQAAPAPEAQEPAAAAENGEAQSARPLGPYAPAEGERKPPAPGPYVPPEGERKPPAPGPYAPDAPRPRPAGR